MNKLLKYVLVPHEIALKAKEKGFKKFCPFIYNESYAYANIEGSKLISCDGDLPIPTHTQLIMWLVEEHNIEVQLQMNGMFTVSDNLGLMVWVDEQNEFELNDAISHALNLLADLC